jgi:GNAT superfamily N-acetyltransferase
MIARRSSSEYNRRLAMAVPAEIEIRPAHDSDAPAILECLSVAFAPYRREYTAAAFEDTILTPAALRVRLQQMQVLVAVSGARIVGTVSAICNAEEGHLRGMAVLPEWCGRGVAAKLLTAIEDELVSRGCKRITLDTTQPLCAAMKFYEKNGYRRSGNISDFFGMPLLEYVKIL